MKLIPANILFVQEYQLKILLWIYIYTYIIMVIDGNQDKCIPTQPISTSSQAQLPGGSIHFALNLLYHH